MVKRDDLRPTRPEDSLKKLIAKVNNGQTVAHGVKVASASEAVLFDDGQGNSWRWDGDAIASYDARIAAGEHAIAEAKEDLAKAEAELEAAKERLEANSGDLSAYIDRVEAAEKQVKQAQADLSAVQSKLDSTATSLDDLEKRTGGVEQSVNANNSLISDALDKAEAADSKASQANQSAQDALSYAQTVQAKADNATRTAQDAQAKAQEAAGLAAGKGKVFFQDSEPSDGTTSDLWIRTTDNKPFVYDGTVWKPVTDKAATDAAAAAATANANAATAQAAADKAQTAADKAQTAADAANTSASRAQSTADTANSAAVKAQSTADTAKSAAATAQTAADAAKSAAAAADAKALQAAGIADSKGRVIYSASAPTEAADKQTQNLWINTTTNAPARWTGSAWQVITDKAATDAATAAAKAQSTADTAVANAQAAQSTADKAVKDAAAAASTAQQANIAAGNAQKTADGKNTNTYGTGTPTAPGVVKGDRYTQVATDGRATAMYEWSGTAWVQRPIDSAQLVNFDASYITSGYLDVAKRIKAGSIFADKLTVGIGDNIIPNGYGQAQDGWESFGYVDATGSGFPKAFTITATTATDVLTKYTSSFPVTPGKYRFSMTAKGEHDGGSIYVRFSYYDFSGAVTYQYALSNQRLKKDSWTTFTADVTIPASTVKMSMTIWANHQNGVQAADTYYYTGFSLRELKDGSLIVNGSITGDKVNANSVAAAVGQFVQVDAKNITVTGELAANIVNAMSTTTKRLVVTEDALLNNATFLGTTVADQLNVTKKLVARDAIVDGTLDVAQLNVTESMAAKIVNAMSTTTKRLVVTEDAILNQLTVIQGIVTPELLAQKINVKQLGADLVTSGAIQTSSAANTGVKINNSGFKAYDASGNLTIDFNGQSNKLVGNFSTSSTALTGINLVHRGTVAGVELYSGAKTANSSFVYSHGSMWYSTPDFPPDDRGLFIAATDRQAVTDDDPAIHIKPVTGIGIQGGISMRSPAMCAGTIENPSLGAGGYFTKDVTFSMKGNISVMVFISPINENSVEVSYGLKNVTKSGFTLTVKNNSTRDTGYQWVKWLAIGYKNGY